MVNYRMTLSRTMKSSRMRGSGDQDRIESENVRFVSLNDRYAEWVYGQGQEEPKAKEDEGLVVQWHEGGNRTVLLRLRKRLWDCTECGA